MNKNTYKDYLASRVISFDKKLSEDIYDKVYYKTNEDLLDIYLDVDFYGKDVFSVMASADHVLTARYLDAKRVDAFDKNILTKYYFYLRIWSIKYDNRLYPNIYNSNSIRDLLIRVHPETQEEKKAYEFYLRHIKDDTIFEKLFYDIDAQPTGRTIYTKSEELEDCISSKIDFYNYDMFKETRHHKQYDIVLLSNILDWARHDQNKLENAALNLNRLVKKEGYILGSNLIERTKTEKEQEVGIMKQFFDLEDERSKAYLYKKK